MNCAFNMTTSIVSLTAPGPNCLQLIPRNHHLSFYEHEIPWEWSLRLMMQLPLLTILSVKGFRTVTFFQPPNFSLVRNQNRSCSDWIILPFCNLLVAEGIYPGGNRTCSTFYKTVRNTMNSKSVILNYSLERMRILISHTTLAPWWSNTGLPNVLAMRAMWGGG